MLNKNQYGMIGDFLIVTTTIIAIGFTSYMVYSANKAPAKTLIDSVENDVEKTVVEYPSLYKQYNLPEYLDAEIIILPEEGKTLDDGLNIVAKSIDDVTKVGNFYEKAFGELAGWTYSPPMAASKTLYIAKAVKTADDLTFQLTITNSQTAPTYASVSLNNLTQWAGRLPELLNEK